MVAKTTWIEAPNFTLLYNHDSLCNKQTLVLPSKEKYQISGSQA